ncbi:MAG: gamma carbonic anhydrase family protein [Anaerolineae bacterium]|nr:gamma carbonic anhydrase family protein [Anaerolineae bacterium]
MGFWEFEGKRPVVGADAFVHPEATLIGGVTIGEGCYVAAGAVLRGDWGDIVVGPGSNIQEHCVLHVRPEETTILGPDCHIGHGAIIHGAHLGRHVMVGMHAVIHDGVVVGDEALIGSGCVVLPDMQIPPGKMVVGVPGKIVGDVSADQQSAWDWGLKQYQALPARCLKHLRPL